MPRAARDTPDALLAELATRPTDAALRERAARALDDDGHAEAAVALLLERLINLTKHTGRPLPCLCKRCLDPGVRTAVSKGTTFHRDYVVVLGRVLFFWLPEDLVPERARVRRSVAASLDLRLLRQRHGLGWYEP